MVATDKHTHTHTHTHTQTDRHTQTDTQTDRHTDTQTTCQKYLFWIQWPSKREHSSKSGSRFFGQMQYFLYTSYSRESKKCQCLQSGLQCTEMCLCHCDDCQNCTIPSDSESDSDDSDT